MKLLKDKIANFKAQKSRITSSRKQAGGKAKKMGDFAAVVSKIREAGGGNSSELKCNGAAGPGADKLTNLTVELTGCEAAINTSCSADLPDYNSTAEDVCSGYIATFENLTSAAISASGDSACTLWQAEDLAAAAVNVKTCDISGENSKFTKQRVLCISAFGKCRKLEDSVTQAISACSSANSLTNVLAAITAGVSNKAAAAEVSSKITAATATARAATANTTCADFITKVTEVTTEVMNAPLSLHLEVLLKAVTALTVSSCSTTEKTSLTSAGDTFKTAAAVIDEAIASKQMDLEISTGSTVSISTLVTTAAASRARHMGVRSAVERFLRRSRA